MIVFSTAMQLMQHSPVWHATLTAPSLREPVVTCTFKWMLPHVRQAVIALARPVSLAVAVEHKHVALFRSMLIMHTMFPHSCPAKRWAEDAAWVGVSHV